MGPHEVLAHRSVVVGEEVAELGSQVINRGKRAVPKQFPNENRDKRSYLIHPGGMFRGVVEYDAMAEISQEGGPVAMANILKLSPLDLAGSLLGVQMPSMVQPTVGSKARLTSWLASPLRSSLN